ncbi:hypothetical protein Taitung233_01050 [Helicobacter pylori]
MHSQNTQTFFDAKSGLTFYLNTALLLVSFFNFFQLFIVVFEKRSATPYKRWLLVFSFTAVDDEI